MIWKKGARRARAPFFLFAIEQTAEHQRFEHRHCAESECASISELARPCSTVASD
jgi:hypothetical protein